MPSEAVPDYVFDLLAAIAGGRPIDFRGHHVPQAVQTKLSRMSTNYYVRYVGPVACDYCGGHRQDVEQEIHLGMSAGGWAFQFRAQPDWTSDDAYRRWVDQLDLGQIYDEYQHPVTRDEMLDIAAHRGQSIYLAADRFVDRKMRVFCPHEFG